MWQLLTTVDKLPYWVMLRMHGIRAHAWNLSTSQQILAASSCSSIQLLPSTVMKTDLRWFTIKAWCHHPYLIPSHVTMFVLEPEVIHDYNPPLFLNLEDIIYHNHPGLSYPIQVDIVEIED
jgi:hypothetical protein